MYLVQTLTAAGEIKPDFAQARRVRIEGGGSKVRAAQASRVTIIGRFSSTLLSSLIRVLGAGCMASIFDVRFCTSWPNKSIITLAFNRRECFCCSPLQV